MHIEPTPEGVRTYRLAKNWTQRELAEHLGVNDGMVTGWESGRSYPGRLVFLALIGLECMESKPSTMGDPPETEPGHLP